MTSRRMACLFVPFFPLAARLRGEPELRDQAAAIFSRASGEGQVVAATLPARRAGVRAGQTLAQARARRRDLQVRSLDSLGERSAQEALLETAEKFSPLVEDASPGVVYLETAGDEHALGQSLQTAAQKQGLSARVGIASNKLTCRIAAELSPLTTIVPRGGEAEFLSRLPLRHLAPDPEVSENLRRWGITAIGDFARLPPAQVEQRLGEAGWKLHRAVRGLDEQPLTPRSRRREFREGMELDWSLTSIEPFLFVGRAALDRLCRRLESFALACGQMELELHLEPGGRDRRLLPLAAPTREVKVLLALLRLELEKSPPASPVTGFEIFARPAPVRTAQLSLFGPAAASPDRLAIALARLSALVGPGRAGSPAAADSHRPESFELRPFTPDPPPKFPAAARTISPRLALRVLRPPVELEISADEIPEFFSSPISGAVRRASGPWRVEELRWSAAGIDRDYWDVETDDGALYRIFRDRKSRRWFADGVHD